MTPTDRIEEAPGQARIVARSDVVVVGGGPSGLAAAIAARREGCSVTLIERYPYLGGLASGGMVLVLDDMHNGDEVTVQGICMEMIERMASVGAAVYPPPEDRRQGWDVYDKWARWGAFDFRSHLKPAPIVMAAAFDPDGWKRISNEMLAEAGVDVRLHSWFSRAIVRDGRIRGVICETKAGREAMLGGVVIDTTGDLDVAAAAGAKFKEGRYIVSTVFRLGGVDTDEAERFREAGAGGLRADRPPGEARHRRIVELLVAEDAAARRRLVQLPAHDGLRRPEGGGPHAGRLRGPQAHLCASSISCGRTFPASRTPSSSTSRRSSACARRRLLRGEYVVTKEDVLERVHFPDTVARGRDYYTPYGAMLPKEVDGLLVAGRHYSATELAQKQSREIPPCMSMGQSAGVAAALALAGDIPVRRVDPRAICARVRAQGGDPGDIPSANAKVMENAA